METNDQKIAIAAKMAQIELSLQQQANKTLADSLAKAFVEMDALQARIKELEAQLSPKPKEGESCP